MEENIQDLTDKELREKLFKLRENRRKEYTQPERKKGRPAELAVSSDLADKVLEEIEKAGGLDALLRQEGLLDDESD